MFNQGRGRILLLRPVPKTKSTMKHRYSILLSSDANNGSNSVIIKVIIPDDKPYLVEITDAADVERAIVLKPRVEQGDIEAIGDFADIVRHYDYFVASQIIIYSAGDEGAGLCMMGEGFENDPDVDDSLAFEAYEHSAEADNICGMCHLGRFYAEGKGCKMNLKLAKKWLTEAATECSDADEYLDQYGLR